MRADHRRHDRRESPRYRHIGERVQQRLTRERIGDDRFREKIGRGDAEALQASGEKEGFQVWRRERQQAADGEDHQAECQDGLAAVGIGYGSED